MSFAIANDGAELYYEEFAQQDANELVLLVHGSLGDYRDWSNQVPFFRDSGFRVVTFSRRNHHPNPWKDYPSNYSLLTERDDIISLLKKVGEQQPANLIGHSYGGYAAALVARDYPQHVRRLVLIEPPIFTILREGESLTLALKFLNDTIEPAREFLMSNDYESGIRVFLEGITGISGVYERLKAQYRSVMLENAKTALPEIEITPERDPFDCTDAERIRVPTLLVKGGQSPRVLQLVIDNLSKCTSKSKVVTIPRSSHGVIWDNPKLFNEILIGFLKQSE